MWLQFSLVRWLPAPSQAQQSRADIWWLLSYLHVPKIISNGITSNEIIEIFIIIFTTNKPCSFHLIFFSFRVFFVVVFWLVLKCQGCLAANAFIHPFLICILCFLCARRHTTRTEFLTVQSLLL